MRKQRILGMAFEGSRVSVAVLGRTAELSSVENTGECDLGMPVASFISGEAAVPVEAVDSLKSAVGGRVDCAGVSIPSEQALLRIMRLPAADQEETAGMVNLQIDKMSPFPIEDMVVGYEVLSEDSGLVSVLGVAVRRKIVENIWKLLGAAGIVPDRVDVNSLVWWDLIRKSGSVSQDGSQVFIIIRDAASEFIVVNGGVPVLFRAFLRSEGQTDLQFMEEICDEISYTLMSLEIEFGAFHDFSITIFHAGVLSEELKERPAGLCGGRLEVKTLDVSAGLAGAVAGRCSHAGVIDLTPASLKEQRAKSGFRKRMIRAFGAIAAVWLVSMAVLFGGVSFQKLRLKRVAAARESIKAEALEVRELRRKVTTIDLYVDRSRSALEALREVSLRQPEGVDITMFNYRKGAELKLSGESSDVNLVYEFKKAMDGSALFTSVSLDGPQKVRGKEVFEITASFPGGEE